MDEEADCPKPQRMDDADDSLLVGTTSVGLDARGFVLLGIWLRTTPRQILKKARLRPFL